MYNVTGNMFTIIRISCSITIRKSNNLPRLSKIYGADAERPPDIDIARLYLLAKRILSLRYKMSSAGSKTFNFKATKSVRDTKLCLI